MFGEGWEYPLGEENPVRFQQTLGVPSAQGNASYPLLLFSCMCLGILYNLSSGGML